MVYENDGNLAEVAYEVVRPELSTPKGLDPKRAF